MAEDKKEFKKTSPLTFEQIKECTDDYGTFKMDQIKAGHHAVFKITGPVVEGEYKYGTPPVTKKTFKMPVELKHKELGDNRAEFILQAGEGCVGRLLKKYPDDKYVGMYAFFSRTAHGDGFPQFINPFEGELAKSKDEIFAAGKSTDIDLTEFDKFKESYFALIKKANMQPNPVHMLGSFINKIEPDRVKALVQKCEEAVKK